MKKQWDEQAILDNIRAGKQAGATYVFQKCGGRLLQFFTGKLKLSHEDAEDALQEAFIRFINSVRNGVFRGEASVCVYLSKIGVNECFRILQKNTAYVDLIIDGIAIEEIIDPKDFEQALHYQLCVAKVLETFEKTEKNAFERLTALTLQFEGRSIKEIANKIDRNEGATKSFLSECRKKIKVYLLKCWDECGW